MGMRIIGCCSTYGGIRSKDFQWKYLKKLLQDNNLHAKEIITIDVYGDDREIIEVLVTSIFFMPILVHYSRMP